ncbi:hypothetical protein HDU88_000715 [Geranomyces variabilis]|nr:hypothetical protein HDU88_000715 [Geranomyces variabilis]
MHFVRVLSWIAAQLVFCHIALAVQLVDIGDVSGVSVISAFGDSVLPILPSYRIYFEDFRDVDDISSRVCTCSWQDENLNNIGQSASFNLSLGFRGRGVWVGPPPMMLNAVQTIVLPLPSSWPVMRSLNIHQEGTSMFGGDESYTYTFFDLPSNGKPGPLIHFRAEGTATWVPYAEDPGYSSHPATYLADATTYDIAIGHVEPRTNPIPLGTDATQIPLIKISSSNGYSFVAGQGNITVGGPAYYTFPWSMPSGTEISYKIQLYWMSPWQAITERTLISGPKVPAKTIQYFQATYAGEPLYFSPDNPITDVPIQSTTRTVELVSFSHGDTVAKSTTAVSRSFTPSDAAPDLVVPAVIELGFYYLRVSWATAPSKFYYSSLFRVNKAFGFDVKVNGVSPGGVLALSGNPVVTWTSSSAGALNLFGDLSSKNGVSGLSTTMSFSSCMIAYGSLTPFKAGTSTIETIFYCGFDDSFVSVFYGDSTAGYSQRQSFPAFTVVDKAFNLVPLDCARGACALGASAGFQITPINYFAMPTSLPTLSNYYLVGQSDASKANQQIQCIASVGGQVSCTLPAVVDSAGPFKIKADWNTEGSVVTLQSGNFLLLPENSTTSVGITCVNPSTTFYSSGSFFHVVVTNPTRAALYNSQALDTMLTLNVGGSTVQNEAIAVLNSDCKGISPSDANFQAGGGQYQLFCTLGFWDTPPYMPFNVTKIQMMKRDHDGTVAESLDFSAMFVKSPNVHDMWPVVATPLSETNPVNETVFMNGVSRPQIFRGQPASIIWKDDMGDAYASAFNADAWQASVNVTVRGLTLDVAYAVPISSWNWNRTALTHSGTFVVPCGWTRGLYRITAYYWGMPDSFDFPATAADRLIKLSMDFEIPVEVVAAAPAGDLCKAGDPVEGSAESISGESSYLSDTGTTTTTSAAFHIRAVSWPAIAASVIGAIVWGVI